MSLAVVSHFKISNQLWTHDALNRIGYATSADISPYNKRMCNLEFLTLNVNVPYHVHLERLGWVKSDIRVLPVTHILKPNLMSGGGSVFPHLDDAISHARQESGKKNEPLGLVPENYVTYGKESALPFIVFISGVYYTIGV